MNLVLIGFCSCGKSATAYALSKQLKLKFVDLDKEIEVRYYLKYGKELHYRKIIEEEGAELFFSIENQFLAELICFDNCIVAPGGGAPLREENKRIIKKLGHIVYLQAEPEVVLKRMQAKGLPLFLRDDPSLANLERIWQQRHRIYQELADYTVDNSRLSIEQTADSVLRLLIDKGIVLSDMRNEPRQ
jgi:shikimate kinase